MYHASEGTWVSEDSDPWDVDTTNTYKHNAEKLDFNILTEVFDDQQFIMLPFLIKKNNTNKISNQ